jgi:TATA-box binding protein (TBP) (component of TFIID and TFIIIB)
MNLLDDNYQTFLKKHPKLVELDPVNIPEDLNISTITMACKIPVKFNVELISKYIQLDMKFIQTIIFGNDREVCRTLVPLKKNKKKTKKKRNMRNQVSLFVAKENDKRINVKIYTNGSIQIAGCKHIPMIFMILQKIFDMFKMKLSPDTEGIQTHEINKRFAEPYIFLNIFDLYDFKICMINSNFEIDMVFDREKIFYKLLKDGYESELDTSRHAGVKIKYLNSRENETEEKHYSTIFIFEKGKIIITGPVSYRQLMECYKFINIYIIENYSYFVKNS